MGFCLRNQEAFYDIRVLSPKTNLKITIGLPRYYVQNDKEAIASKKVYFSKLIMRTFPLKYAQFAEVY